LLLHVLPPVPVFDGSPVLFGINDASSELGEQLLA
jgi:hypothetical protein